ncbi:hypothetical protein ES703_86273 [subsurface metagenome]
MKKLLGITDSEEFWRVFSEEREARRGQFRNLPFAKKIEIVEKMRAAQPSPHGRLPTSES